LPAGLLDKLLLPENLESLTAILLYHVVDGAVYSSDLTDGDTVTLEGSSVTTLITSDGVTVNEANVTTADIAATNGVIHVIDQVLIPPFVDIESL
jgi:uncharacterized surface protein with fasciclin (FAS1) repeats